MANRPQSAGASSYILYGEETTFGTPVTPTKHFGIDTNFEASFKNNTKAHKGFKGSATSGRDTQAYTFGKAELDLTVDFDLTDDGIFKSILGTYTSATKTYSGADTLPSITITHSIDNETTDRCETYAGCVVDSATIKGAEGEPITCSLSLKSANYKTSTTLTTNTALSGIAPYTFCEAIFELPSGTAITNIINDFDLTISNNVTLHYGTSRKAVAPTFGARDYSLKLSTKYVDDAILQKALGGDEIQTDGPTQNATLKIVLTNKDNSTLTFSFGISPIDTFNLKAALGEAIGEDIELQCSSLTIVKSA